MRVAVFNTRPYDQHHLDRAVDDRGDSLELTYLEPRLSIQTAGLADGFPAICVFVNDDASAPVLAELASRGVKLIALRCSGFNNVDLNAAADLNIRIVRVPAYSPHAVAEHAVGLILALNRKIHRAHNRVREGNFALDGLQGFDLNRRTVGIIGTGQIGAVVARILHGFGCRLLGHDPQPNPDCQGLGLEYVDLPHLLNLADIVTLHCPLVPDTYHLIDDSALCQMKRGAMLINTSRGALIDTNAVLDALKSQRLGYLGLDVYEEEEALFFQDLSSQIIQDDVFARLLVFPNVIVTAHQAYFTNDALESIARTTIENLCAFRDRRPLTNQVAPDRHRAAGG